MGWAIARARAQGKDIYVGATEAGSRLYFKAGFEKIGEFPFKEGVMGYLMLWRAPEL